MPARLTAWCRRPPATLPRTRPRPRGRLPGASPGGLLGGTCPAGLPAVEAARHVPIRAVARRHLIPAAVLLRGGLVPVRHAAAVPGVVLPLLPSALASRSVAALVDVLFLVLVDVDVLITATTSAVVVVIVDLVVTPVAVTPYGGADRHPGAEREQARRGDVAGRIPRHCGVVRRRGCPVHGLRTVLGDVHDLRIRRLHPDDLLLLDDLTGDDLLLRRLEGTGLVCLRPHPLDRVEDLVLLVEEGIPQILRPVEIVRHALEQVGKARERLHARVPVLALERLVEGLALQTRVLRAPASSLDHLEGIGRRDQDLHGEPVRIERDGRDELLDLRRRELRGLCRRRRPVGRLLGGAGEACDQRRKRDEDQRERATPSGCAFPVGRPIEHRASARPSIGRHGGPIPLEPVCVLPFRASALRRAAVRSRRVLGRVIDRRSYRRRPPGSHRWR